LPSLRQRQSKRVSCEQIWFFGFALWFSSQTDIYARVCQ
jgi:hypothetical protein